MEQKFVVAWLSQLSQRESELPCNYEDGLSACSHDNSRLHNELPTHDFSHRNADDRSKEKFVLAHIEGRPRIGQNNFSIATPDTPHRSLSNPPSHPHYYFDTTQDPTETSAFD